MVIKKKKETVETPVIPTVTKNLGLTVTDLAVICYEQIKAGNGDKHIVISADDEGNAFHTLFYGFNSSREDIEYYRENGYFHDNNDVETTIMLG